MNVIAKITRWVETVPTTNSRILITLMLAIATAIKYFASSTWEPSWEWLMFLIAWAGLDIAQKANARLHIQKMNGHAEVEDTSSPIEDERG